jgi:TP901 family phage tail tape measure protein
MATLEYVIAGNNSGLKKSINESIDLIKKLTASIDALNAKTVNSFTKAAQSADKFNTAAKKGTQAFKDNSIASALDKLNTKITVASGNFELFGGSVKRSQGQITTYQTAINALLANGLKPTDERVIALKGNIDKLTKSIEFQKQAAASAGTPSTFANKLGTGLGGAVDSLKGLASGYLGVFAAVAGVSKVIQSNAEISDSLADVRRSANLTQPEVENLFLSLKKIDTRTSLKGLSDIAVIGGQLGIAKGQLAGFTKAIDQLAVTLSNEIPGGAEEVATALGKINGVFKTQEQEGTDVERAFNKTGSAILKLGQVGLATGGYLQDFALRVAGVSKTANISLPTVLAYSAVLEESGSSAEVAGTAFNKLVGNLATKRSEFFAIAKIADSTLTLKEFTRLINTDANAALQKFFQGLNAGGKDLTSFSDLINEIGIKAGPGRNAIIALAQGQELLNTRIGESKKAYDDGTLSAEQFAIKNDTLGGSVGKLTKSFVSLTTTGGIGSFFKYVIDGITGVSNAISSVTQTKSWSEFFERLSTPFGKENKRIIDVKYSLKESLKTANTERTSFTKENNPLGASNDILASALSTKTPKELKDLITKYADITRQSAKALNSYKTEVAKGNLTDGGDFSVKQATKDCYGLRNIVDVLTQAYIKARPAAKAAVSSLALGETADADLATVKEIQARIKQLKDDALSTPTNKSGDIERIIALNKRLKELNGSTGGRERENSFAAISNSLDDILLKTDALTNQSGLQGYDLQVQKIVDTYVKLNSEVDKAVAKSAKDFSSGKITKEQFNTIQGKVSTDRAALTSAEQRERSDAEIAENQRVVNEVQRIRDSFGVRSEESQAKELAVIKAKYDAEIIKAQGNADLIKAIEAGKLAAVENITEKYLAIQNDLYQKIGLIEDESIAASGNRVEKETDKLALEFEKRKKSANDYYEALKKINGANIPAIERDQANSNTLIDKAKKDAQARLANRPIEDALKQVTAGFISDLSNGLFNASNQAGADFKSVFSGIASSFANTIQNVVVSRLSDSLIKGIDIGLKGLSGKLQGIIGGLAIAGGLVSGLTQKTSTVGQGVGGALSGAAYGAAIGSVVPVIGTVAGAVVGGIAGLIGGIFGSSKARKEEEERQKQQLEEEKKQTALLRQSALAYTSAIVGRMTANGIITNVDVGAQGQLVASVSGKDLQFVLDRNKKSR